MLNPDFKKVCKHIDRINLSNGSIMIKLLVFLLIEDTINQVTHEVLKNTNDEYEAQLIEFIAFTWYVNEYKNF